MLTQEYLKSILRYDPETGEFTWLISKDGVKRGSIAGSVSAHNGKKYCVIKINRHPYYAHRLAFLYMEGVFPENETDHIGGDGIDNKWVNLRSVSRAENGKNQCLRVTSISGVVGVSWNKTRSKWEAQICVNGKRMFLGYFSDKNMAAGARKAASIKYGFHPNHGQIRIRQST